MTENGAKRARGASGKNADAGGAAAGRGSADGEAGAPEEAYTAEPFVPARPSLGSLRRAAADCRGCPLHRDATQTVFGAGRKSARLFVLGEQPGDQEDRKGEPFVGPAGGLLHRALAEADIDPADTYVTNAVKHFKFSYTERTGKRRIHKPPTLRELSACGPWLARELALIEPELIVALGATAGKALAGSAFRVGEWRGAVRGREVHGRTERILATVHPSSVLRADDREAAFQGLVADLRVAARELG